MTGSLTALLHLCDSLFPLGAFAHSDGLESATTEGRIVSAPDLQAWLETTVDQPLRHLEGPAVARAHQAFAKADLVALLALDGELLAMRPSSTGREASRAMGLRLLKTWHQLRPSVALQALLTDRVSLTLPVAFGVVTASSSIAVDEAIAGFIYTRLAAIVSAAMRLIAIGQHEAHARLAAALDRVPAMVDEILADRDAPLRTFTPAMDLAMMRQQYGHSRLFRS